jgi:hypothetical protein
MSRIVIHNDTVYLCGQVGAEGKSIEEQAETMLAKVDALLEEAGSDRGHILSVTAGTVLRGFRGCGRQEIAARRTRLERRDLMGLATNGACKSTPRFFGGVPCCPGGKEIFPCLTGLNVISVLVV